MNLRLSLMSISCGLVLALHAESFAQSGDSTGKADPSPFPPLAGLRQASAETEPAALPSPLAAEVPSPVGEYDYGTVADDERLFGLFAHSETGFNKFISPMTNTVFFEDPRTLTEVRPFYIRHKVPNSAGGGTLNVFAVQVRAALTDRLSIIATKDGFLTSSNPLIDDGWADVAAGLKLNLIKDVENQFLLSGGLVYELPAGSQRSLQGNGDGEFNLFLTGGMEIFPRIHWVSATGFRLPTDTTAESQVWYWSNHWDYEVVENVYGVLELNWYHWMKSGKGGIPGVEGNDLFNFGSTGVAGKNVVTLAFGMRVKPADNMEVGIAWEVPVTSLEFVTNNRLTVDWIIRY